jgi:hypothetical protein
MDFSTAYSNDGEFFLAPASAQRLRASAARPATRKCSALGTRQRSGPGPLQALVRPHLPAVVSLSCNHHGVVCRQTRSRQRALELDKAPDTAI